MMIVNYGLNQIDWTLFEKPTEVNELNKLNGGLWACPERDWFSDWFVLTLYLPILVREGATMGLNYLQLHPSARILTLTLDNYQQYLSGNQLDVEKVLAYDVLHLTDELVEQVELFDSYYVESYQILNPEAVLKVERVPLSFGDLFNPTFRETSQQVFSMLCERVKHSRYFQNLI